MRQGARFFFIFSLLVVSVLAVPRSISPSSADRDPRPGELPLDDLSSCLDSRRTASEDYIWPTDATVIMTSSFGEFRNTHLHAGIDISTNDRRGYKVFASRDGYVSRIFVSPYGYGKMLYVRHADQHTTTYAHLQRFNDEIDSYVRLRQQQSGRYPLNIDLRPTQFPVGKGDVIAYSGSTGIGSPHLHFEVRDEELHPINPLLFPAFAQRVTDTSPPEFQRIGFTPLDYASAVQGNPHPKAMPVRRLNGFSYRFDGPLHLSGSVGVSVKTADRANHPWHRNGIYRLELYVDSILLYSSELNGFPENFSKQVALHYDWQLLHSREGAMQKLYVDRGNRLPLYDRLPELAGVLNVESVGEGYHELTAVAYDIAGNRSELRGAFILNHPPRLDVQEFDQKYYLSSPDLDDLRSVTITANRANGGWSARSYEPANLTPTVFGLELPLEKNRTEVAKILATNRYETSSAPVFLYLEKRRGNPASLRLSTEFIRDFLSFTLQSQGTITSHLRVVLTSGSRQQQVTVRAVDAQRYVGTSPLSIVEAGVVTVQAEAEVNGIPAITRDQFTLFPVLPESGGRVVGRDGEFTIDFPQDGVYAPLYCRVEKTEEGYSVQPNHVLLNRGGVVRYRIPSSYATAKVGLYSSTNGSWNLVAVPDPDDPTTLKATITRFLGDFSIRMDPDPPSLDQPHIRYQRKKIIISFKLRDGRSGVDANSIKILLDSTVFVGEYDPYGHKVVYEGAHDLSRGYHTVIAEAADHMGNKTSSRRSFLVSGR